MARTVYTNPLVKRAVWRLQDNTHFRRYGRHSWQVSPAAMWDRINVAAMLRADAPRAYFATRGAK